jgi:chromate transport protein ChrA
MSTQSISARAPDVPAHGITFREAVMTWAKIAALSFGGPAACPLLGVVYSVIAGHAA